MRLASACVRFSSSIAAPSVGSSSAAHISSLVWATPNGELARDHRRVLDGPVEQRLALDDLQHEADAQRLGGVDDAGR